MQPFVMLQKLVQQGQVRPPFLKAFLVQNWKQSLLHL